MLYDNCIIFDCFHSGVEFVDRFRADLIERVVSVEPILDEMLQLIGVDKYSKVRQAKTSQEKMRELYIILDGGGQKLKEEFYRSLLKHEEFLLFKGEIKLI
uniref:CARD domain-containing protein n=1 Tax=Astyanax mexicanus TaxID=7994 RepID=A0A3B1J5E2_ASTMX